MNRSTSAHSTPRLRELFSFLWSRLGKQRITFMLAIALLLSDTFLMMYVPKLMELYFNHIEIGDLEYIKWLLIAGTFLTVLLMGFSMLGFYLKQYTMSSLHRDVMVELADEAQRLPLENTLASHTADITQRVAMDSGKTTWTLVPLLEGMGGQIVMIIMAAIYMLWLQWQVALAVIILTPLGLLGSHMLRKRLQRIGLEVAEQEAVVRQCLQDALQGMETLRAFGAENWMEQRFVQQRTMLNELYLRRMWWQQLVNGITASLAQFIVWGSILFIAWLAIQGTFQLGALMAFFLLVWRIYNPLLNLGRMWAEIQENLGAARRVFTLLNAKKESSISPKLNQEDCSAIQLQEVSFRYMENSGLQDAHLVPDLNPEEKLLLNHYQLHINPGTFTAIVGPSGSGKSTVAKLCAGLLHPKEGNVEILGHNPQHNAEYARHFVSYVPQTPYLFSGTIRENLILGRTDARHEEMEQAARLAQAHEFIIALPDGYETRIKEHGDSLSGGQKQRLAIARAILAERPIWIFDEATSALDTETERKVMEAILAKTRAQGRTLLCIAHRLTTVQEADVIILMENGLILKHGTHMQHLQNKNGLYAKLWEQISGERPAV
jgi:ATP-binding cassette subfamily B protein